MSVPGPFNELVQGLRPDAPVNPFNVSPNAPPPAALEAAVRAGVANRNKAAAAKAANRAAVNAAYEANVAEGAANDAAASARLAANLAREPNIPSGTSTYNKFVSGNTPTVNNSNGSNNNNPFASVRQGTSRDPTFVQAAKRGISWANKNGAPLTNVRSFNKNNRASAVSGSPPGPFNVQGTSVKNESLKNENTPTFMNRLFGRRTSQKLYKKGSVNDKGSTVWVRYIINGTKRRWYKGVVLERVKGSWPPTVRVKFEDGKTESVPLATLRGTPPPAENNVYKAPASPPKKTLRNRLFGPRKLKTFGPPRNINTTRWNRFGKSPKRTPANPGDFTGLFPRDLQDTFLRLQKQREGDPIRQGAPTLLPGKAVNKAHDAKGLIYEINGLARKTLERGLPQVSQSAYKKHRRELYNLIQMSQTLGGSTRRTLKKIISYIKSYPDSVGVSGNYNDLKVNAAAFRGGRTRRNSRKSRKSRKNRSNKRRNTRKH